MRFEWDERKDCSNRAKHRVGFETAMLAFEDPFHLSRVERIEGGEERWQTIGFASDQMLLMVVHTTRDLDDEEVIRIISARRATTKERRRYEDAHA